MVKVNEKDFTDELTKRGYVKVFSVKYCGVSFVGGVHSIYLHPAGVISFFEFETDEFEVDESFGKNPARSEEEDDMPKKIRRAMMHAVVPSCEVLDNLKYAASKFDTEQVYKNRIRIDFDYDFYDNQINGHERANTANDLFYMISDIITLPLLTRLKEHEYFRRVFVSPDECVFYDDNPEIDVLIQKRKLLIETENPAFFNL